MKERRILSWAFLLGAVFVALWVYSPSFAGGPISDDHIYLMSPYVTEPTPGSLAAFLHPLSPETLWFRNYSPVRALAHTIEWRLFDPMGTAGPGSLGSVGYHILNVLLHCVAAWLLMLLFVSSGLPFASAAIGGAVFLLHPANVEAVAWMNQLWSPLAMIFAIGALLTTTRRPGVGVALFGLSLLTKPLAVSVLPVAVAVEATRMGRSPDARSQWGWLALWGGIALAFGVLELAVFWATNSDSSVGYAPDAAATFRGIFALAARYFLLATTTVGASAFAQPPPSGSWMDLWWLAGLVLGCAVFVRGVSTLRRRQPEGAFWLWVVAGFAPVCQIFPFLYPFADRYAYFILPGLIGAILWLVRPLLARSAAPVARTAGVLAIAFLLLLAWRSHDRAGLWVSEDLLLVDAARHYPEGVPALILDSRRSARAGDAEGVAQALEAAHRLGWDYYRFVEQHPDYVRVRGHTAVETVLDDVVRASIARTVTSRRMTPSVLIDLAAGYKRLGELDEAEDALERALEFGDQTAGQARSDLTAVRALRARLKQ